MSGSPDGLPPLPPVSEQVRSQTLSHPSPKPKPTPRATQLNKETKENLIKQVISLERKLRNSGTATAKDWKKDRDALQTKIGNLETEKERHREEIAGLHAELQELRPNDSLLCGIDDVLTDEETARRQMREEISRLGLELRDTRAQWGVTLAKLNISEARTAELQEEAASIPTPFRLKQLTAEKEQLEKRIQEMNEESMLVSEKIGCPDVLLYTQSMWELTRNELNKATELAVQRDIELSNTQIQLELAMEQLSIYQESAEPYIGKNVGELMSVAPNMILREAASGGLLNPIHFKVGNPGLVCLTGLGLERARLFRERPSQKALIQRWTEDKTAEANERIREIMRRAGFYNYGHSSLLTFADDVGRRKILSIGNLIEGIREVDLATRSIIDRIKEGLKNLEGHQEVLKDCDARSLQGRDALNKRRDIMRNMTEGIIKDLKLICCHYYDGSLPKDLRFLITLSPIADWDLTDKIWSICNFYSTLVEEGKRMTEDCKIPDHYIAPWEETTT